MSSAKDIKGMKFGKLTAIKRDEERIATRTKKNNQIYWLCQCDCGNQTLKSVTVAALISGNTKSCGCYQKQRAAETQFKDITGEVFGRLTVVGQIGRNKRQETLWSCTCSCGSGKEVITIGNRLKSGKTKSCGCLKKENGAARVIDISGQKFGRLTVISHCGSNKEGKSLWLCKCDCDGKEVTVIGKELRNGHTQSCGCLQRERAKEANTKHNLTGTKIYNVWASMKQRCYDNSQENYKFYGGKGISVCEDWNADFITFYNDMYESYVRHIERFGEKETTIDRIDCGGNYEISNCRWATWDAQHLNTAMYETNTSGCSGAYWREHLQKYELRIHFLGKTVPLGCHTNLEDCRKLRKEAEIKYYTPIIESGTTYPILEKEPLVILNPLFTRKQLEI